MVQFFGDFIFMIQWLECRLEDQAPRTKHRAITVCAPQDRLLNQGLGLGLPRRSEARCVHGGGSRQGRSVRHPTPSTWISGWRDDVVLTRPALAMASMQPPTSARPLNPWRCSVGGLDACFRGVLRDRQETVSSDAAGEDRRLSGRPRQPSPVHPSRRPIIPG